MDDNRTILLKPNLERLTELFYYEMSPATDRRLQRTSDLRNNRGLALRNGRTLAVYLSGPDQSADYGVQLL